MTPEEQATMMIGQYMDLQRIEKAVDVQKEIENQKTELVAKLEALGIVTEKLVLK